MLLKTIIILSCSFLLLNVQSSLSQNITQWGEIYTRNMVSDEDNLPSFFDPESGKNLKWKVSIGSHGYATPIIAGDKVLVGANNAAQYDKKHEGDRGTLICFNEKDGSFLWQLTVPRIEGDRHNDWPMVGICSPPTVEGDKVFILTNRSEILCLDINGQYNGNDGLFQGEGWFMARSGEFAYKVDNNDADILWCYDMKLQLGMSPHDSPHASILIDGDYLYINTCNGVDYRHLATCSPEAPSLIVLDKHTGRLVAKDNEKFGPRIFHSSWSSPSMGIVNGEKQVFFAGPDGLVYGFKALAKNIAKDKIHILEKIWQFDCDPAAPKENIHSYLRNREESPSNSLGMPVFYKNRIYVTVGGDIWWGKRKAWIKCIDATKTGDITASGEIWSTELEKHSAATPAISKGLVYVTDCNKNLHCIDVQNGEIYWKHKLRMDSWSSALVADKKVYVGSRGGDFWILQEGKKTTVLCSAKLDRPIHSTPTVSNGVLYIATMNTLYAIEE